MKQLLDLHLAKISGKSIFSEDSTLPDGSYARKFSSQNEIVVGFNGENGKLGGVSFSSDQILVVPVYFTVPHSVYFHMRFYENRGVTDKQRCADIAMGVLPGFTVNITYELRSLDLGTLFLARTPGRLKNVSTGQPVRAERLNAFELVIPPSNTPQTVWVGTPYITDTAPEHKIPDVPQVDTIGQWKYKDWAGKTADEAEMIANYRRWLAEELPSMEGRSKYGGDLSLNLGATGYFRAVVHNGKHYLADPDGYGIRFGSLLGGRKRP